MKYAICGRCYIRHGANAFLQCDLPLEVRTVWSQTLLLNSSPQPSSLSSQSRPYLETLVREVHSVLRCPPLLTTPNTRSGAEMDAE